MAKRFTYLTRADDVGVASYDSIAWALGVHVKMPDDGTFKAAIMLGNEDSPARISFYDHVDVTVDSDPAFVWTEFWTVPARIA